MAPAPVKNPNVPNKIVSGSTSSHTSASFQAATNGTAASSSGRKTGTVPKSSIATKNSTPTSQSDNNSEILLGQNGQHKPVLQQPPGVIAQQANRCSPLNIVASIQQQQQNIRSSHHPQQMQHKNTEIVAPIRRELDLNVRF